MKIGIKMTKSWRKRSLFIGSFVLIHIIMSASILFIMLALGINPTLVVSDLAAPLWVVVTVTSWTLTKKMRKGKHI